MKCVKPIYLFKFENDVIDKLYFQILSKYLEKSIIIDDLINETTWSQYNVEL